MPLDRLVLIVVCVIAAAGLTIWLAALVLASVNIPFAAFGLIPAMLVVYIVVRVIAERVGNQTEDHYDKMDH